MKAGLLLIIAAEVIDLLKNRGFISPDGEFSDFKNIPNDLSLVSGIENILKTHGVLIPGRVDAIINILPLIVSFIR